jgi:hypothetical protein
MVLLGKWTGNAQMYANPPGNATKGFWAAPKVYWQLVGKFPNKSGDLLGAFIAVSPYVYIGLDKKQLACVTKMETKTKQKS